MTKSLYLLAACLAFAGSGTPSRAEEKTNVLFLICDDLNCDIGAYGHPQVKTPNIDRLAERGVRFENAHCQYALCGPSRASFMTGLYPDQTLVHTNAIYVREHTPNVKTMPQMFRDNGYFATRIGKMYHYNVPTHIGTGGHDDPYSWDFTINPRGRDVEDEPEIFSLRPGNFGGTLSWLAADGTDEEQTDGIIATEAVEQLDRYAEEDRAFFLAVGLFRPHTPFVAPKEYFDLYPLEEIVVPTVPEGYEETLPEPALKTIRRKKDQVDLEDDLAREAIQAYYASITFADAQVGRILDALEETGLAENTVVLFTSDHGYHMGEHGHWQKTTLFENATRVPLIIASPDQQGRGVVSDSAAEMIDLYPTLAQLCGLKAPDHVSGVSLVPVLDDPAAAPRDSALSQYANGYSLRTDRYRYSEWGKNGATGAELYDRRSDPEEMVNLAGKPESEETVAELSGKLRKRIAEARSVPEGLQQLEFDDVRRVRN
ncbi:MAG: sulfatase [Verrucomicrobiales bacterium]